MTRKKLATYVFWGAFVGVMLVPVVALAQEGGGEAAEAVAITVGAGMQTIGAALAMGLSALGAGYAQAKIGSAGQGTLAERPDERVFVLVLTALPEIIALLGFVMAIILAG